MAAIEELLSSIMVDYENMSSLTGSELVSKCDKIRGNLRAIIDCNLSDAKRLRREIEKTKGKTSQTKMVLDVLHRLVSQFPHPVFAPSSALFQTLPQSEKELSIRSYKDFMFSTCNSLMRLLAMPTLEDIHSTILKLLTVVFELVKTKNIAMLRDLIMKLVELSSELNMIHEDSLSSSEEGLKSFEANLSCFSIGDSETNAPLQIDSFESLDSLRKNCTLLLQVLIPDLHQYAADQIDIVWCTALFQLEHGDFCLKSCSINILTALLQNCGMPHEKMLHYFIFCIIASIEMAISLLKIPGHLSLRDEKGWKDFLIAISPLMDELFTLQQTEGEFKICEIASGTDLKRLCAKHAVPEDYITSLCESMKDELEGIVVSGQEKYTEEEECTFIKSVGKCLLYVASVSRRRLSSAVPPPTKLFEHIGHLCFWVLESGFLFKGTLDCGAEFVVESLLLELEHNSMRAVRSELNHDYDLQPFKMKEIFENRLKHVCSKILKFSTDCVSEIAFQGHCAAMSDYCCILKIFIQTIFGALSFDSPPPSLLTVWLSEVIGLLLNTNGVKTLMKSVLNVMKSLVDLKESDAKFLLPYYGYSVKIVQLFSLLLQVGSSLGRDFMNSKVDAFSKELMLPFMSVVSVPWLEMPKLEDFAADLASSGIQQSTLMPICKKLRELGTDVSTKREMPPQALIVICDCLKSLAIMHGTKYPRWRSLILFKWATSAQTEISNVALSVLWIFICKSRPATGAFKGILTHLKSLLSKIRENYSHPSLFAMCLLLREVVNLIKSDCEMAIDSGINAARDYCESCAQFQPCVADLKLTLKPRVIARQNFSKTVKDDAIKLLGVIAAQVNDILKDKWRHSVEKLNSLQNCFPKDGNTQKCILMLQTTFLRFAGDYITLSEKKMVLKDFFEEWLAHMEYFSDNDFCNVLGRVCSSAEDSPLNYALRESIDSLLLTSFQRKNLKSHLHSIILLGSMLNASLSHSEHEFAYSDMLAWAVSRLCANLSSSLSLVQSAAYLQLCRLQKNDTLQKYGTDICICIFKSLVGDHPISGKRSLIEILEDIAHLFLLSPSEFIHHNLQTILPVVVTSKQSESMIKLFSDISGVNRADILMQNFKHIFCHAVVTNYSLDTLFQFLEVETRIKKESLLLLNFGGLLHHLVSHISVSEEQVRRAINGIYNVKESSSEKMPRNAEDESISELLQPHFLGILTFFNCQLRSASVPASEKKRIIESLACLLRLMRCKEVTLVRVKVINTLCLAQQLFKHRIWHTACCNAWNTFITSVEPSCLGSLLSQITVTLLPLLDTSPDQVSKILTYLVIERADFTKENLSELYFLPEHSALVKITKKVQEEIRKRQKDDLGTYLTQAVQLMSHESSEVRVQALSWLCQVLKDKQRDVQHHHSRNGRDITDSLLSLLVSTLLFGCRDHNKQIRLLSGKCLGQIGAIDPDRLVLSLPGTSARLADFFAIDDPDFAFNLISDLVKAFLAAKPTHQDISAFAIQELLKIYECREGPKDTHGRRLWRRFSENVQEVLEPHHTSRYLLKKTEIPLSNLKQPVLFRKPNMTFRDWTGSLCALLMQMVYESNDECTASRVFCACSAVVKNDADIALLLLPHTALQVLLMTGHMDFVVQEVLAVLEQTEQLKDRGHIESEHESSNTRSNSVVEQPPFQGNSANVMNSQYARGSHLLQLSAQAIFSILDHIRRWLRQAEVSVTESKSKLTRSSRGREASSNTLVVKAFLSKIPELLLAQASFRCRAYRRALLHYEAHLRDSKTSASLETGYTVDEKAIDFLQQLFVEMDEPDGVAGIAAVRLGKPTLNIQIKQLESTGKLQDACACYAHAIQQNPDDLHRTKDYVKCLMDLGQLSTAARVVDGTLAKQSTWKNELNSYRVEAAWRLGHWDVLEECLDVPSDSKSVLTTTPSASHDWNTRLGELLLVVRGKNWDKFQGLIDEIYLDQTGPLSAASMESGSYSRGYNSILRLHMLTELEAFVDQLRSSTIDLREVANRCYGLWQERRKPVQKSFKPREPVLSLQRTMLHLLCTAGKNVSEQESGRDAVVQRLVGKLWLESAKQARKAGYLQTAYNALINAQQLDLPEFCIEQAKWLWNKGESHRALLTLQKGVADHFPDEGEVDTSRNEKMSKAKAMLLVARLMEESSSFDSNTVLKQFKEAARYMSEWEDSHFYAAKYYDKLMTAFKGDNRSAGRANHLYFIMNHYSQSLSYGTSHIYESLTKLLTLWLDYEANVAKLEKASKVYSKEDARKLIDVITEMRGRLPAYIFLTAFSQLVSRICHPHLPTFEELKQVVAKVICAYPQQALWTMMAISKSSYSQRAQRCKEIFNLAMSKNRKLSKILSDATRLTDKLLELCNKPCAAVQSLSIATHFRSLKRLVEEDTFSEILLPLQQFMTVTLPQSDSFGTSAHDQSAAQQETKEHEPFPGNAVYIVGFEDTVEILASLQRPKKVSIRASDGRSYLFLCKPKDDLRKDARLMEFNTIVNKCLKLNSETRKRQLKIRTYAVVPLNEECGLLEWVPNTHGLRHILLKIYKAKGLYTSGKILKSLQLPYSAPMEQKLDVFRNKLLPIHPAVFGDWFLSTFPDPTSWYNARLAYASSTAVMSMVGYILGLGDRHGENILFDSTTGEAVHVDFNCLFNKGLTLDVPEIVPFRLTHNMTDAMGPMRHEGFFRCSCETVMYLLRQQREPLLSVLKTFIYDPLVEWSKRSLCGQSSDSGEILNEMALSRVNDIDKRLRGIAAKNRALPLSVEGHVHYLIQEATDEEKLCQMYIGWAPYM